MQLGNAPLSSSSQRFACSWPCPGVGWFRVIVFGQPGDTIPVAAEAVERCPFSTLVLRLCASATLAALNWSKKRLSPVPLHYFSYSPKNIKNFISPLSLLKGSSVTAVLINHTLFALLLFFFFFLLLLHKQPFFGAGPRLLFALWAAHCAAKAAAAVA